MMNFNLRQHASYFYYTQLAPPKHDILEEFRTSLPSFCSLSAIALKLALFGVMLLRKLKISTSPWYGYTKAKFITCLLLHTPMPSSALAKQSIAKLARLSFRGFWLMLFRIFLFTFGSVFFFLMPKRVRSQS